MEGLLLGFEVQVTAALIAFARIGTAMMFLPGFGEASIPARHRLGLALILSLGLMPALPVVPPSQPSLLALLLAREALIGLYIGAGARILFATLHALGGLVAFVSSFSNALAAGDTTYEGSTVITSLFTISALALLFVTDAHHIMIRGLFASYEAIPAGWAPLGDLAEQLVKLASKSFYIMAFLGAPFFVLAILWNLSLGLANRVMPAMPVFFVAGPAIMILGLTLLMLTQASIFTLFIDRFAEFFGTLTP